MSQRDTIVHLLAGGAGGTVGAIVTCPLEVVKTRLQSSVATFHNVYLTTDNAPSQQRLRISTCSAFRSSEPNFKPNFLLTLHPASAAAAAAAASASQCPRHATASIGIWKCIRHIVETEGFRALFKGLGPNLIGVAPSRAIYFCTYSSTKSFLIDNWSPESPLVHMCSAVCAGFTACTATNPIWFVKTRLQLDQRKDGSLNALQCIRNVYRSKGLLGFYKGISASYVGISETVIHFVIYEAIKARLREYRQADYFDEKTSRDFLEFMLAGATSKTCASILAYPHEVVRTRLRQEGNKYQTFWQTLNTVFQEEGHRGLYRGLWTQLVRQIPNTAIMMATYEAVVYLLQSNGNGYTSSGTIHNSSSTAIRSNECSDLTDSCYDED